MPEKRKITTNTIFRIFCLIIGVLSLIAAVTVIFIDPKKDLYITLSIALFIIGIGFTSCAVPFRRTRSNDDKPIK